MNVAVILAAGESKRMGGQPKQLLPFAGKPMLQCVIDALPVDERIVVLGYRADVIAGKINGARIVINKDYAAGMFTSVQAGLRALPARTKCVLVALADQPKLRAETVRTLLGRFTGKIVVPSFGGRQGHPLLLAARYVPEILAMDGSLTLKHFLANHPGDLTRLVVEDEGVLVDVDSPEDYRRIVGCVPSRGEALRPRRLRRLDVVWAGGQSPAYFLTICVGGRARVLANDAFHSRLRDFLRTSAQRYGWWPGRYVVMPDHLHLLVTQTGTPRGGTRPTTLGEWVKALKAMTGQRKIAWQRSFFDHVLRSEESESEKWEYVRQNPVRAGLVKRAEDWLYAGDIEHEQE
jgi:CTP:molybdopterin cytidylyltransferase MocA/REP element-mobilizing transposase RayT